MKSQYLNRIAEIINNFFKKVWRFGKTIAILIEGNEKG